MSKTFDFGDNSEPLTVLLCHFTDRDRNLKIPLSFREAILKVLEMELCGVAKSE